MRVTDFDFELPTSQIAQFPAAERSEARLYVMRRDGAASSHERIKDLPSLLPSNALLVVNDTRVFPARLHGRKLTGGRVELLLLRRERQSFAGTEWSEEWSCLGGSSKGLKAGQPLLLDGERAPAATVVEVRGAEATLRFTGAAHEADGMFTVAERIGEVPLPPYIRRSSSPDMADGTRYQTVYARVAGSAAAPTAGLHFTPELLAALASRGIERAAITLHIGTGTFAPFRSDDLNAISELHAEPWFISSEAARAIAAARDSGRPVIAVGTTTVRTLESACDDRGRIAPGAGETRMFIRPGHRFLAVDGLLTNFHLPRSSLLVLIAAFAGRERVLSAYRDAVDRGYRFYSYGDAMLIT